MKTPLISIITVVYNAASTLDATIRSVLGQEPELFEYWIIDGGSTDGSIDIISRHESQLAGWISEPDNGIYDAMNKGIDLATGDWLYFLGADDTLSDSILAKVSSCLQPKLATVYGDVMFDNGHIMRSHIGLRCIFENRLHHQSAFYNRNLFDNFRYNQKFRICADYELTLRIYLQRQQSLHIPHVVALFASGGISDELTSADINSIRGQYIKSSSLNMLLSFMIDTYYSYVRLKRLVKRKLKDLTKI